MKKILNSLHNTLKVPVIILITFLLFKGYLEIKILELILPLFTGFRQSIPAEIIFIGLAAMTIVITFNKIQFKYLQSLRLTSVFVVFTIIYLFYRINGAPWDYEPILSCKYIYYFDLLPLLTFSYLILYLFNQFSLKKNIIKRDTSKEDIPITNASEDLLGYSNYAKEIYQLIMKTKNSESFSIGVLGNWGSGKTSFINLLFNELNTDNNILIRFNPWSSQSQSTLIKDFFNTLSEALSQYSSSLPGILNSYSDQLTESSPGFFSQIYNSVIASLYLDTSIETSRVKIEELIIKLNKKIIVFIDDLDRLDKNEVFEVLRLIRNSSNFPGTIFIAAYDRNYVIQAIRNINGQNSGNYLEKVFQLEIVLPGYEQNRLQEELSRCIKSNISPNYHTAIDSLVIDTPSSKNTIIPLFIRNIRDAKRFSITFSLHFNLLSEEVVLHELFLIELIRFKYPTIYDFIYRNKAKYFDDSNKKDGSEIIELSNNHQMISSPIESSLKKEIFLFSYLRENHVYFGIQHFELDAIEYLLSTLFRSDPNDVFNKPPRLNSILNKHSFDRYFSYRLFYKQLSEGEFLKYYSKSTDEFLNQIPKWINANQEYALVKRLFSIKLSKNIDVFEKILRSLFLIGSTVSKENPSQYIYVNHEEIINSINSFEISAKTKDDHTLSKQIQTTISHLLKNAKYPFLFESDMIYKILYNLFDSFPLSKNELHTLALYYLKEYLSNSKKFTSQIWSIYHACDIHLKVPLNNNNFSRLLLIDQEANDLLKDFIQRIDILGFLQLITIKHPNENNLYQVSPVIDNIFPNEGEFLSFIEPFKTNPEISEFIELYNLQERLSYKLYSQFQFNLFKPNFK